MQNRLDIIKILKNYSQIEAFGKECSYILHQKITHTNHSFLSHLFSLAIPLSSTLSFATKLLSDGCRILETVSTSIYRQELAIGNVQTFLADLGEDGHHIFGMAFGLPIALVSPHYAANAFLTVPANDFPPFLSEENGSRLYAMGHLLDAFFNEYHIDYRICSGTALGARRENGIIKNDDDMDLLLHPNSVDTFTKLIKSGKFSKETGISIKEQPWTGGWQCFYDESPKGEESTPLQGVGYPFIDIFPGAYRSIASEEKPVITYGEDKMYLQSRGDYFTEAEWSKPIRYQFGPTYLNGIESMDPYLKRSYGPLALQYHTQLYSHPIYASIYAHPQQLLSTIYNNKGPRYTRHEKPTPLEYTKSLYLSKISIWGKTAQNKEIESDDKKISKKLI